MVTDGFFVHPSWYHHVYSNPREVKGIRLHFSSRKAGCGVWRNGSGWNVRCGHTAGPVRSLEDMKCQSVEPLAGRTGGPRTPPRPPRHLRLRQQRPPGYGHGSRRRRHPLYLRCSRSNAHPHGRAGSAYITNECDTTDRVSTQKLPVCKKSWVWRHSMG